MKNLAKDLVGSSFSLILFITAKMRVCLEVL